MSTIGNCKKCGKKRVSLPARGLCSVCYRAERDAERAAERKVDEVVIDEVADESVVAVVENPVVAVVENPVVAVVDCDAADFPALLDATLADLRKFLIAKNRAYGNSALEPVRVFSKADPVEQLRVRIDDKLSRLLRGADCGEDTELDLLGYLTLLQVARRWPCTSAVTGAKKA
ncbi:MAG: hypothetical protein RBT64_10380 [Trichloromonas sp.]|nr:hypothetical protein [Trichloromonas sp.]